jgi:hypothetical protein
MKRSLCCLLFVLVAGSGPSAGWAQLKNRQRYFAEDLLIGTTSSFQLRWVTAGKEPRMAAKESPHFAILQTRDWKPAGKEPYLRSIVSRTVWPLAYVLKNDVGKTVTFRGLFGWYGGEPGRSRDLFLSPTSGFHAAKSFPPEGPEKPLQGLEGGKPFEFGSLREGEWSEVAFSYKIRPADVGLVLFVQVQVQSKNEESKGLPVLATADWKMTVSD